ncbi:MAG: hypothetical protein ACYDD4_06225 [Acidimicrobiales bacterium]
MEASAGGRSEGSRPGRRVRIALAGASVALLGTGAVLGLTGTTAAVADGSPGQGSSYAQTLQIAPHEGSLAVGAIMGVAIAGHTGSFARAQSQGVDLGAVGESMRGWNCGSPPNQNVYNAVPEPISTESGAPNASTGVTQGPSQSDYFANEFVKATTDPYGEADTTYAGPFGDPTGAVQISGAHSKAWSGVVNGVAEAGATSDIGQVILGGGTVVLDNLDWSTTYPVDSSKGQPIGTFSIGGVTIGGVTLPNLPDLGSLSTQINKALVNLGLQVILPSSSLVEGEESVSPLSVEVVPNTYRDTVLDTAIATELGPYYFDVANGLENGFAADPSPYSGLGAAETSSQGQQLEAALCQSDTPITVLDITIASMDGGGFFSADIGGVNSSAGPLVANNFNLAELNFGSLGTPGTSQFIPGTAASTDSTSLSLPSTPAAPSVPATAQPSTSTPPVAATRAAGTIRPAVAGSLLAAGLGGLGLLVLLVAGDGRMMRRAQKAFVTDE